ncbi:PREDICTED: putative tRNA pseudouridine synthase Pus10 [Fragaria vesca subsp. vesca]|uniref:putative tRNA pseudouridine synthase Pus10 n=1 Tax=Fragaria vesca subsp. vesca TaxID=101020 RepID=UPI0002C3240B|nr:PREDICTED: putative tRNA pseudouridine synthase Pus10 [Fragaria vesca subsp. vesca]
MATEIEAASPATVNGDDVRALYDAVRALPSHAVIELFSIGVCTRCILRLFGVSGSVHYHSPLSQSMLSSVFSDSTDLDNRSSLREPVVCRLCLGILQFTYSEDKKVVKKESVEGLAAYICNLIREQGFEIDSFSLEVSIPPVVLENERIVWDHLKTKFESELQLQERSLPECISVKDALKVSLTETLETMLDCRSSTGTFRIRLTYTYPVSSETVENSVDGCHGSKRRKTGTQIHFASSDDETKCSGFSASEPESMQAIKSLNCPKFRMEQTNEPCCLEFLCYRTQIYFGGRYLKYSRNVSQSCWIIDDERMGEASVEEIIGSNILPICRGDKYKFHAAGREDIDVRMLGSGRPFLVEVQNARYVPSQESVKDLQAKINNLQNKLVGVKNLKLVGSQSWDLMREGEAEKQKQYTALVWTSRILKDEDFQSISSVKDMHILQRTPIRVLHRRSPLERKRIIHWMRIERIVGSSQYFLLHLCTQAGTYIKEFVHGDLGRTQPCFGSILDTRAEILRLDVTDVKMDCFLTE